MSKSDTHSNATTRVLRVGVYLYDRVNYVGQYMMVFLFLVTSFSLYLSAIKHQFTPQCGLRWSCEQLLQNCRRTMRLLIRDGERKRCRESERCWKGDEEEEAASGKDSLRFCTH